MQQNIKEFWPNFIKDRFVGKDVHIVASGPSLLGFDYSFFAARTTVALNHAYKKVPNYDFKVFGDRNFMREDPKAHLSGISVVPEAKLYNRVPENERSGLVPFTWCGEYSSEPGKVYGIGSVGVYALSIVLMGRPDRVFLWGYDYRFSGRNHHATPEFDHTINGGVNGERITAHENIFKAQVHRFSPFPRDRIFNMSLESNIPYFAKFENWLDAQTAIGYTQKQT